VTDEKRPLDLALDAFVYVPVGFALSARELLPELAERGRARLLGPVTAARVLGRLALHQGQVKVQQRLEHLQTEPTTPPPSPAAKAPTGPRRAPRSTARLAVPGYDSLSASQVLPRLEGLSPPELEALRAYEEAHRGRKTVLGRVAQLQSAS
jgi:hypothetical protein